VLLSGTISGRVTPFEKRRKNFCESKFISTSFERERSAAGNTLGEEMERKKERDGGKRRIGK